jgi:hypothetical protein
VKLLITQWPSDFLQRFQDAAFGGSGTPLDLLSTTNKSLHGGPVFWF